jgi:hypothetical protein
MNGDQNIAGASSVALLSSLAALPSTRPNAFLPSTIAPKNAMAASSFLSSTQPHRGPVTSQSAYALSLAPVSILDRDATMPIGTPFTATPSVALSTALIRNLPINTSEESLRLMMVFSKDLHSVEILPVEQTDDSAFRAAILKFKTQAGAFEAKNMLDGKSNFSNDANMTVEIIDASPGSGRRYPIDTSISANTSTGTSSTASSATSSRQPSRFNGTFQALNEKMNMPLSGGVFSPAELSGSESSAHYHSIFSPQSPIGNHLTERNRISGKALINNDAADDDETGELLKDPVAWAENGAMANTQRRRTVPAIPVSRLAALSLNTTATAATAPATMQMYGHPGMGAPHPAHANTMSPTVIGGPGPMSFNQHYRTPNYPPANPADQNPPCNTLYVGNLPIDTSEEELKAMFSKCRGYKRLCFRTKQNGPMCFVEFEDVSSATRALHELYGHPLHNSVKGGIRLSFSKNPLGVRSSQNPTQITTGSMAGMSGTQVSAGNGFTTANGPPPGLSAPPGLGASRLGYIGSTGLATGSNSPYSATSYPNSSSNMWNMNYQTMAAGGPTSMLASTSSFPPHMMGR